MTATAATALPDEEHPAWPALPEIVRPRQIPRRPLNPPELDEYLVEYIDSMEDGLETMRKYLVASAIADSDYSSLVDERKLTSPAKTGEARTADARFHARKELYAKNIAEALKDYVGEMMRCRRSEIEAIRTLCATARSAASGRG